jgi:hypothetical protein
VKSLAIWIIKILCSSEGILEPRWVSAVRQRKLEKSYGMVDKIMRVCQKE